MLTPTGQIGLGYGFGVEQFLTSGPQPFTGPEPAPEKQCTCAPPPSQRGPWGHGLTGPGMGMQQVTKIIIQIMRIMHLFPLYIQK